MKNLRLLRKLLGDDALANVVLATTSWDHIEYNIGVERENQLRGRRGFGAMFRQDKGEKSAREIVNYLIDRRRKVSI